MAAQHHPQLTAQIAHITHTHTQTHIHTHRQLVHSHQLLYANTSLHTNTHTHINTWFTAVSSCACSSEDRLLSSINLRERDARLRRAIISSEYAHTQHENE
jgi:hypothetical protein